MGERVSVLMMDLDNFKGINDTFGHDGGDRVIIALADLLKRYCARKMHWAPGVTSLLLYFLV